MGSGPVFAGVGNGLIFNKLLKLQRSPPMSGLPRLAGTGTRQAVRSSAPKETRA
jgi:hypothetical protein